MVVEPTTKELKEHQNFLKKSLKKKTPVCWIFFTELARFGERPKLLSPRAVSQAGGARVPAAGGAIEVARGHAEA